MKNDLPAIQTAQAANVSTVMGFGNLASFEFLQRAAKLFSSSSMVPTAYQATITKGYGDRATTEQNQSAISNCVVALDMAQRMSANPLMIMQNLHIIEGRPSWSSQFIIAAINGCGKFSPLRFDLQWLDEIDAAYSTYTGYGRDKKEQKNTVRIRNARCVAWAIEKATGERLESAPVTIEMAVAEGWYVKNGSKWKTMPDLMLRYRAAAFFGRIYAPELLMGLPAAEEMHDIIEVVEPDGAVQKRNVIKGMQRVDPETGEVSAPTSPYPDDQFSKNLPTWTGVIESGKKNADDLIAMVQSRNPALKFTDEQSLVLRSIGAVTDAEPVEDVPAPTESVLPPAPSSIEIPQPEYDNGPV